ncbi:MAG: hypothetical protein RMI91_13335 [Gemmatales bacterium]|nr:hypothetical protein [Gemmatales bacterium]MDW7995628.1 hypothetical protein [Gemmatales bacterium]
MSLISFSLMPTLILSALALVILAPLQPALLTQKPTTSPTTSMGRNTRCDMPAPFLDSALTWLTSGSNWPPVVCEKEHYPAVG